MLFGIYFVFNIINNRMADLIISALFSNMAETQLFSEDRKNHLIQLFIQWGMKLREDF